MRKQLFADVKKKYKAEPEYLWSRYPDYAIFRHSDNKKYSTCIYHRYIRPMQLVLDADGTVAIELGKR